MSGLEQGTYIVKEEDNLGLFKKYRCSLASPSENNTMSSVTSDYKCYG